VSAPIPYRSIADLVDAKHLTWRMYARSMCSGIVGLDANKTIRSSNDWPTFPAGKGMSSCYDDYASYKNVLGSNNDHFRIPETTFPGDEKAGSNHSPLASVTWVLPGPFTSDHPGVPLGWCGPTWVSTVVNAIGNNAADWNSTVIFVLWDDWGGFYDHVPPYVVRDQAGPGFRVPLLVISPYVRHGVIHTNTEFATLNKFVETTFGLGSLGATDSSPFINNMNDFFDFNAPAQKFVQVPQPSFSECNNYDYGSRVLHPRPGVKVPKWLRLVGEDPD
jgi:phospholipase C